MPNPNRARLKVQQSNLDGNREWSYVLRAYSRLGVSSACLVLQDRLGVDVVVMLHLAYVCMEHRVDTTERDVALADVAVRSWREEVVSRLRSARRSIDKNDETLKKLRAGIQDMEVLAEQHAFARLSALPTPITKSPLGSIRYSVLPVAAFYAQREGCMNQLDQPSVREAIRLLDEQLFTRSTSS